MSSIKLSRNETIQLIRSFKHFECLWNAQKPVYKRNDLKRIAWLKIAQNFGYDVDQIKKKLKYLRTSYLAEKKKVLELKKANPNDESYEPTLFYFAEMGFLEDVIVLRASKYENRKDHIDVGNSDSNMSFLQNIKVNSEYWNENNTNTSEEDKSCTSSESNKRGKLVKLNEDEENQSESNHLEERDMQVESYFDSPKHKGKGEIIRDPPLETLTKHKMKAKISNASELHEGATNTTCNCITKNSTSINEDMFKMFGNSIAAQLKSLPLQNASRAMAQIQNVVTEQLIASLYEKK